MTIVVFHRGKSFSCEYDRWLNDYAGSVILVVSSEMNRPEHRGTSSIPNSTFYGQIIFLDHYDESGPFQAVLRDIQQVTNISRIIAHYEFDLLRVAEYRDRHSIAGQTLSSAIGFRDKQRMKEYASAKGLIGYRFQPVSNWNDVQQFHESLEQPKPIILKPRSGSTSLGIIRVDDPHRQRSAIEALLSSPLTLSPDYMVEEFVDGDMYHVDGLILGGECRLLWPSQYVTGSLEFQDSEGQTVSSAMLSADDSLCRRINQFVLQVIDALPTPRNCNIHCEVFVTPSGTIELCEIASRVGGVRIKHGIERAFGVDITEEWHRADALLPQRCTSILPVPKTLTGWATMAGRSGTVSAIPDTCDIDGVWSYQRTVSIGDVLKPPQSAVDYIANCDLEGPDQETVISLIAETRQWFASNFATKQICNG